MIDDRQSGSFWLWAITVLSALAFAISAYLGWHYLVGGSVIGCGGGSPCEEVLGSRWSMVAGVLPTSGLAAGTYLAMLVASFCIGPASAAPLRQLAWGAMLLLAGAAAGSALWFTIVQVCIIGAFCPMCMATHIVGLLLAVLIVWRATTTGAMDAWPIEVSSITPRRAIWCLPAIGLALAGILAACQVAMPPAAVYRSGESQNGSPAIDPHAVPLAGSPDALYVVTMLFDYQCPHCQRLHLMLDEAIRRYGGTLAFALCPGPLNFKCNPYISKDIDEFKDSCELAKVGLAVWAAKREAFPEFDRWMFSFDTGDRWRPRSLEAATAKAVELVGQAKFDAARADPWIDRYLQTCIQIYGNTIHSDPRGSAMPKLVFGSRWVTPELYDADDLVSILHDSLALPSPQ